MDFQRLARNDRLNSCPPEHLQRPFGEAALAVLRISNERHAGDIDGGHLRSACQAVLRWHRKAKTVGEQRPVD